MVPLAEQLIPHGKELATFKRRSVYGRPFKSQCLLNVGEHLPVQGGSRRCHRCHQKNKTETRTKTVCNQRNVALCPNCFADFHI